MCMEHATRKEAAHGVPVPNAAWLVCMTLLNVVSLRQRTRRSDAFSMVRNDVAAAMRTRMIEDD